jgi:hypothetical protein
VIAFAHVLLRDLSCFQTCSNCSLSNNDKERAFLARAFGECFDLLGTHAMPRAMPQTIHVDCKTVDLLKKGSGKPQASAVCQNLQLGCQAHSTSKFVGCLARSAIEAPGLERPLDMEAEDMDGQPSQKRQGAQLQDTGKPLESPAKRLSVSVQQNRTGDGKTSSDRGRSPIGTTNADLL